MRKKCYMLSIAALLLAACSSSEDTTLNQEPLSQDYIMLRPMTTGTTRGVVTTATNFREFYVKTSAVSGTPTDFVQYDNIVNIIENLQIASSTVCINRDEYPIVSQLSDIEARMDPCDGCVIFACEYMQITDGCLHKDMDSVDRKPLSNISLVSPWLHIEAAIANSKNMPCLIIYDKDLFTSN